MEHKIRLIYSTRDILRMFKVHKATLLRWLQKGTFPQPDIKISCRSKFWKKSTIDKLYKKNGATIKNNI